MSKPKKIKELQELPVNMVGDGKSPNVFFVSEQGVITTVTRDFLVAYEAWKTLSYMTPLRECMLEDRKIGVIASVEPIEDGSDKLVTRDDVYTFRKSLGISYLVS